MKNYFQELKHSITSIGELNEKLNSNPYGLLNGYRNNNYQAMKLQNGNYYNPNRILLSRGSEKTVINSVYNRLALDAAAIEIKHVRVDKDDRYETEIKSSLNDCLTYEANIDQTGPALIQDIVTTMLDEGCVAVIPTEYDDTTKEIYSLRTGKIKQWYPSAVEVSVYNDLTGDRIDITLPKREIAIIENPFMSVMNAPNSTMQRLVRKLMLNDNADDAAGSGNIDAVVKLPYPVKTETRKQQAEIRRQEISDQLRNSDYGIAYIDATEDFMQLNRPVENNLLKQIDRLTAQLLSQLGITESILDGTADENTMNNYYGRIIEPILGSIVDEFNRKFITKTARTQGQRIMYFRDPFKLVPVNLVAEMSDKFTRNEILSSNEMRQIIGRRPSKDPSADELRNKNLSQPKENIRKEPIEENQNEDNVKKEDIKQINKEDQKDGL